jgi:hypothetical protein
MMLRLLPEILIGPLLVGASTLAYRRYGARVGGLVSAFPAVVGPVLLITAQERGAAIASRTASATLLGLITLSAFSVAYAWTARARTDHDAGWPASLVAGWACAAALALVVALSDVAPSLPMALAVATLSLIAAHRALPATDQAAAGPAPRDRELPLRMSVTAVLVGGLSIAAVQLGPLVGGMLAGLPLLATVLAVFTHRRDGPGALLVMLRGMLAGMSGFVGFCAVVAVTIVPAGITAAFPAALATALALQLTLVRRRAVA